MPTDPLEVGLLVLDVGFLAGRMEREENVQEQTHFCLIACSFASKYPNGCVSSRHLSELSGYAASLGMTRAVGELRTSLS